VLRAIFLIFSCMKHKRMSSYRST